MDRSCSTCKFFVEYKSIKIKGFTSTNTEKSGICGRPGIRMSGLMSTNSTMNCDLWNKDRNNKIDFNYVRK